MAHEGNSLKSTVGEDLGGYANPKDYSDLAPVEPDYAAYQPTMTDMKKAGITLLQTLAQPPKKMATRPAAPTPKGVAMIGGAMCPLATHEYNGASHIRIAPAIMIPTADSPQTWQDDETFQTRASKAHYSISKQYVKHAAGDASMGEKRNEIEPVLRSLASSPRFRPGHYCIGLFGGDMSPSPSKRPCSTTYTSSSSGRSPEHAQGLQVSKEHGANG